MSGAQSRGLVTPNKSPAAELSDPEAKRQMLEIARGYAPRTRRGMVTGDVNLEPGAIELWYLWLAIYDRRAQ